MLESLAYDTRNGNVYAYIKGVQGKKVLYNNGTHYFVKHKGNNIVFKDEHEKIVNFINN